MKKFLLAVLITLLLITLVVNFGRYTIHISAGGSKVDFVQLDGMRLLELLSTNLSASSRTLYLELFDTVGSLGSIGQTFVDGITNTEITGWLVIDYILGFVRSLYNAIFGFIDMIASVIKLALSLIRWEFDLLKTIYNLLNLILGTSLPS